MRILFSDKRLWFLLAALVLLRLPNINRPVSKHHEFNTAVILINAESWQQAGGGKKFCFTPLMNYQGESNKVLDKGWHIDKKGNHVYLSFGAGWYVLPYLLFEAFHLPVTPLSLRWISIIIGMITALVLYLLLFKVTAQSSAAFAGTLLFVLLPAPLWYQGIGYVTTAVMLPLLLVILYLWHRFEKQVASVNFKYCFALFLSGIALCYFDWLAVFLLGTMAVWALFRARNNTNYIWVSIVAMLSTFSGITLVLVQFADYLGWEQVLHYWQSRFGERSTDTSEFSFGMMLWMVIKHLATGYLPFFLIIPFIFRTKLFSPNRHQVKWPLWALAAIVPYNGVFLNWSAQHEFAWMPFSLFSCVVITVYLFPFIPGNRLWKSLMIISAISLLQYYVINLPGPVSIRGDRYDQQKKLGEWIQKNVDPNIPLFTNLENDKIVEYYSKRTFNSASNPQVALSTTRSFGLDEAVWLGIENGKVKRITRFLSPSH